MPRRSHPVVTGQADLRRRLGVRVRELRTARDLSQAELGHPSFDRQYVSAVETGRITPSLPATLHFARVLGISMSRLLQGVDPLPRGRRPS